MAHKKRAKYSEMKKAVDELGILDIHMKPGDILFFNHRILHASSSNISEKDRKAVIMQLQFHDIDKDLEIFKSYNDYRKNFLLDVYHQKISTEMAIGSKYGDMIPKGNGNTRNLHICIHGIIGGKHGKNGKGGPFDVAILHKHIWDRIVLPNKKVFKEINFYIHTWDTFQETFIKRYFKPKKMICTPQRYSHKNGTEAYFKKGREVTRKYSKWHSLFKSVPLCRPYVKDTDVILSIRFDLAYKHDLEILGGNRASSMEKEPTIFIPSDDRNWNKNHCNDSRRISDYFFFGEAKHLIDIFTPAKWEQLLLMMDEKDVDVMSEKNRFNKRIKMDNHTIAKTILSAPFSSGTTIHKCEDFTSHDNIETFRLKGEEWQKLQ